MKIFSATLCLLLILLLPLFSTGPAFAADISFESFEAAEAAAKKRADEYQKKMQEHINSVNEQWEKQQKDLGSDSSSPDISKITTKQDGQKSSDSDASKSLENAVNSSINKLKDEMVGKASPNSTGFAGGAAGYQWSVKFKDGKYVLSDSYNEAEFNTGKKKDAEKTPDPVSKPVETAANDNEDNVDQPASSDDPVASKPSSDATPDTSSTASSQPTTPAAGTTAPAGEKPAATDKPSTTATKPEEPAKPLPGVDPAPVKLPPPSVRLVIQHPTDFSEEVFASNASSQTTANFKLDKFKIPEDTRIKIAVEVGDDVNPEDVTMVVTDDQGDSTPVGAAKLKNYRHMFRVPSDDQYSASVFVADKKSPGSQQKKILQVMIPVSKVDFESRTIDNQKSSKSGSGSSNMSSGDTSSSGGNESVSHSSFGKPQQVDLTDLYSNPSSTTLSSSDAGNSGNSNESENSGSSSDGSGISGTSDASGDAGSSDSHSGTAANGGTEGYSPTGTSNDAGANPGAGSDESGANEAGSSSSDGQGNSGDARTTSISDNTTGGPGGANDSSNSDGSDSASSSSSGNNSSSEDDNGAGSEAADGSLPSDISSPDEAGQSKAGETDSEAGGIDGSGKRPALTGAATKNSAVDGKPLTDEEDPFLLALSLRAEAQKVYQSFDFIDGTTQTSASIKAGGEIAFSLSLGTQVDPETVLIRLSDGSQEIKGNLKRMGESFAFMFPQPTESAYIEVSGKAGKRNFSYRVGIPVK